MATDEAILTHVGNGDAPPTLRFYSWRSPWVSLGSAESFHDLDFGALKARGWGTLRRASGGAAVLHAGQLGYAIVLPAGHPLWLGDLIHSYERLSVPLLHAFRALGARVEAVPPGTNAAFTANAPVLGARSCFGALGPYEIVSSEGKKLVGNAQVRRKASAAQHGVIQVSGGQRALAEVVSTDAPAERAALAAYLDRQVTSLAAVVGRAITREAVEIALIDAFAQCLGIRFIESSLSTAERATASELIASKYGNPEWTFRR